MEGVPLSGVCPARDLALPGSLSRRDLTPSRVYPAGTHYGLGGIYPVGTFRPPYSPLTLPPLGILYIQKPRLRQRTRFLTIDNTSQL